MNLKKFFSVLVVVLGLLMEWGAHYINQQVEEGKLKVSSAEKSVSQTQSIFSLNPISKQIGDGIAKSADRKIDHANQEISSYANLAQSLQVGGIILIILGIGFFIFSCRKV